MCKYCEELKNPIMTTDNPTIKYHAEVALRPVRDKYKLCVFLVEDDDTWDDEKWVIPKSGCVDANYCFHCGRDLRGE